MNTFMVKVTMKNSLLSGYEWLNGKPSHLDCYVEVEAETLHQAVDIVTEKYDDKKNYWIKSDENYMKLDPINVN